jgi:hypothetical protein
VKGKGVLLDIEGSYLNRFADKVYEQLKTMIAKNVKPLETKASLTNEVLAEEVMNQALFCKSQLITTLHRCDDVLNSVKPTAQRGS